MNNILVGQLNKVNFVEIIESVIDKRLTSDIASIGGAEFEAQLTKKLTNKTYKVFTQKMIETLIVNRGIEFVFPNKTFGEVMNSSHEMGNLFYGVDLFCFTVKGGVYTYVDHVSLKTSVSKNQGRVYIVNDGDGDLVPSIVKGEDTQLGQVVIVNVDLPDSGVGTYQVYYFDGTVNDMISGLTPKPFYDGQGRVKPELTFMGLFGKVKKDGKRGDVQAVKVINRQNKKEGNKDTSFTRGLTVHPNFLPEFSTLIVSGEFNVGSIMTTVCDELLSR